MDGMLKGLELLRGADLEATYTGKSGGVAHDGEKISVIRGLEGEKRSRYRWWLRG